MDLSFTVAGDQPLHAGTYTRSSFPIFSASAYNLIQNLKGDQSKVYLFLRPRVRRSSVLTSANKFICK